MKKALKIIVAAIAALAVVLTVLLGALGGTGPLKGIKEARLKNDPGNAEKYHLENAEELRDSPIKGKNICFLGSSVTYGACSLETSFADYIAKRNGCDYTKEAVSGTTLVDTSDSSYVSRMKANLDPDTSYDCFVVQLSTNDATFKKALGAVSESTDMDDFDTETVAGAIEYIIAYVQETWGCPVIFYTGTKYDSERYEEMVNLLLETQTKWDITVIDLWHDADMNSVSDEDYDLYMWDGIHPTQAGYLEWWTPKMEQALYQVLAG